MYVRYLAHSKCPINESDYYFFAQLGVETDLGLDPGFTTYELSDLGQVTKPV